MLLSIHLFIATISFIILFLAFIIDKNNDKSINRTLMAISFVLFSFLSFTSFYLEETHCQNQISWLNQTNNNTAISNNIACTQYPTTDETLAYFYIGIAVLCLVFFIAYMFAEAERM